MILENPFQVKTSPKYRQTVLEITSARQVQISTRSVCSKLLAQLRDLGWHVSTTSCKTLLSFRWIPPPEEESEVAMGKVSYLFVTFIQVIVRITAQHFATSVEACGQCALQITETWTSIKTLHTSIKTLHTDYLLTFRGTALCGSTDLHLPVCDTRLHGRPLPK